jgi:hypothetical protein
MELKTTFKELYSFRPCFNKSKKVLELKFGSRFKSCDNIAEMKKLLSDEEFNSEITILDILNHNGPQDAFWALRTQKYKDYCIVLADVADSVAHIYNDRYPHDDRINDCIKAVKDYSYGLITLDQLKTSANSAEFATQDVGMVHVKHSVLTAVFATGLGTCTDTEAASFAADSASFVGDNDNTGYSATARNKQWEKNGKILRDFLTSK